MSRPKSEAPKDAVELHPPLAFLPLFLGRQPGMKFSEMSRLASQNAGAWMMLGFGTLFVILNALQGSVQMVAMNLAFISVGATSLWLAAAGFLRTSLLLLSFGSCLVFFGAALAFKNGMENYLLVILAASMLLLDTTITRVVIGGLNAAAFFYVKFKIAEEGLETTLSPVRYGTNVLLFLLALAGIIEFFRVLNSDYVRSLEAKNAELEASNRAKERLFSVVAHDLRGPVGNLRTSLELLESDALSHEEFRALVSDLATDIEKSHACVENLLSWSATQLGGIKVEIDRHNLRSLIAESEKSCSFAAKRKGVHLHTAVDAQAYVFADGQKMQVVFRNLLTNAVKFTPTGGDVNVTARREGDYWTAVVADSGVGMDPERAASLFSGDGVGYSTPGTASERGLGLGSEICREFVKLCGGTITAESQLGAGTRVFVALPAAT